MNKPTEVTLGIGDESILTNKQKVIKEVKSFIAIVLVVFTFRSMFFEPFKIPSGSMIPTLMIGDFILVNKMAYGLKVPFSDMYWDPIYIYKNSTPKAGEVVVFKFPKDPNINYIKRVVGVPGDTIEIINKVLYINGQEVASRRVDGKNFMQDMDDKFNTKKLTFHQSKLGDNQFTYQLDEENWYNTDLEKRTIPPGHYFVMGDNRDFSYDSRFWGLVPFEFIKGRAVLVWFSMIFPWNEFPTKFRGHRIGTMIY